MAPHEESKMLVSIRVIKWFSGIGSTAAIGCFCFLWSMNTFKAKTEEKMLQYDIHFNSVDMNGARMEHDIQGTQSDIIHLQDNKQDKTFTNQN